MAWGNQSGGQPKGPWGHGPAPAPGGGMRPREFEALLKKAWDDVRRTLPVGSLGRRGWTMIGVVALLLWVATGVYTVSPQEDGLVLRFGKLVKHTGSGTHWHLPWPIETAFTPNVTGNNQVNVGFKPGDGDQNEDVPEESYMLTGDEKIVDMQFTVNWRTKDANAFLFNVDYNKPSDVVKPVAESAMREVVGQDRTDLIMTSHREEIQLKVMRLMQRILDSYGVGIEVTGVKMQKAEYPRQLRDAYLDVQKALADQDKARNDAEAYATRIIPQARGEAARIVQDAEAYKQQSIALATGEAKRFDAIYQEYKKAPAVTRQRIYIETMTQVLAPANKVIVDDAVKGATFQLPPPPKPATAKPEAAGGAP